MSNVKITQLPLATTPLTGTEVFPLVQGTTTKQVSITGLFTSPVMTNPTLGTVGQADLINATGLPISTGVAGLGSGIATFLGTPSSANLRAAVTDETGTGALVFATSPTLVTPDLGTPTAMVATNITGTALGLIAGSAVTNANLTGAVTSVGNATSLGSFTSAQLRTALTDETGSGVAVFATSPTLVTPDLGTPSAGVLTNATGLPLTTGVTGTLGLGNGGTGQTTANAAFNALAPSQTGNSGKYLTTDGSNTSWATNPLGTVTSVGGTGTVSGISLSGTVTTSGNLTLGGALDLSAYNGAGAFTTLSASSSVTLSGGTANGVTYLNGSKVLTSGSALTFDGTRLGIGSSAAASTTLDVYGESQHTYLVIRNGAQTNPGYTSPTLYSPASGQLGFGLAASEQMRLTSTGLGIGTSSPATYLQVASKTAGDSPTIRISNDTTGTGSATLSLYRSAADNAAVIHNPAGLRKTLQFIATHPSSVGMLWSTSDGTTTTDRMTLDSSGNVGIGTSSPNEKLEVYGASAGVLRLSTSAKAFNIYTNNSDGTLYFRDVVASLNRMALDSAGNLGLGVTPSAWRSNYKAIQAGNGAAFSGATSSNTAWMASNWYVNSSNVDTYIGTGQATVYAQGSGQHLWYTASSGTAGNAISFTQAMTLDASGNLVVGTTSAQVRFQASSTSAAPAPTLGTASGTAYFTNNDTAYGMFVGSTAQGPTWMQVMRRDSATAYDLLLQPSGGNLLVGTTDSAASSGPGFKVLGGRPVVVNAASTNGGATVYEAYSTGAAAYRFYVGMGGTVYATSTTITAISDQRLKENIRDLDEGLATVMALKPRKFDWKTGKGQDIKNARGFIAQEFETVLPDMIEEWLDPAPEGEEAYKAINANLIPTLVKALQEQQAIIESLKVRLDAANL